jgi:hypothetical protein
MGYSRFVDPSEEKETVLQEDETLPVSVSTMEGG